MGSHASRTRALAACAWLVLGALAFAPQRADACSCADPQTTTDLISPADGATGVPRNARILLGGRQASGDAGLSPDARPLALFDATGDVVPTTRSELSGVGLVVALHPEALLEAGERYEVRAGEERLTSFTVGSLVDEVPPPPPRVVGVETQSSLDFLPGLGGSSCGPSATARFALEGVDLFTVASLDGDPAFDAEGISGQVAALEPGQVILVGRGGCATSWGEAGPLASANVRFGTYDVAGNFSGWSQPKGVVLPPPGCRCDASGVPERRVPFAGLGLLLAIAGLLSLRPRRAGGCSGSPGRDSSGRSAP